MHIKNIATLFSKKKKISFYLEAKSLQHDRTT